MNYANQRLRQFRIELYASISLGILSLGGFLLFIVLNQLEPLIAGGIFFSISLLFVSLKPYKRYQLIRRLDRKSTRLNSSHVAISYAVFCLKKKKNKIS